MAEIGSALRSPVEAHMDVENSATAGAAAGSPPVEEGEENIYEVMKGHMRRQKEETDARNVQARQQGRVAGRPGAQGAGGSANAQQTPQAVTTRVTDLTDMAAVWEGTRVHLQTSVRYLESVLGHCCRLESLNVETGETVLLVPGSQKGFANEKARGKIEEALRAVTGRGIRLALQFMQEEPRSAAPEGSRSGASGPGMASQRVPAEVIEAIKQQRVVQELMKRLDASVVNVELLGTGDAE